MQTKDLILLIAIPILLVSIIYYVDKSNLITGAATAANNENEVVGAYSVLPSFKTNIGYNIKDEYGKIKTELKSMIEGCSADDIEKCMKRKSSEKGWDCAGNEEVNSILSDFVDKFNDCANLAEESVVCRFNLDKSKWINNQKSIRHFKIEFTDWFNEKSKVRLFEDDTFITEQFVHLNGVFSADFDKRESTSRKLDSVAFYINFKEENPSIEKATGNIENPKQEVSLSSSFLFYKSKNGVRFIEKLYRDSFIGLNKFINLPTTRGIKFCVKSGKQAIAYDASDGLVKQRDIIYKFAVTFPKSVPKPIENLKPYYAKKSENSVILTWDKPDEEGINSYSIYYSKKDFIENKIDDIKNDDEIKKVSVPGEPFREIEDINLEDNCINLDAPCKYSVYGQALEKEKLYYWKNKFIYLIKNAEDDIQYNFAVTALNGEGEISNDGSIPGNTYLLSSDKNYVKFTSKDDLAPGKVTELNKILTPEGKIKLTWNKPLKNLDGTNSNDVAGFNIYYKKSTSDLLPQLEIGYLAKQITTKDAKCDASVALSCEFGTDSIAGLEKGQNYNFAVVAYDKKSNEYRFESDKVSAVVQ